MKRSELELENGCRLIACRRPGQSAALVVEVAAGSHDGDPAWPGLAHFFEHMVFLGGQRFAEDQRLMPFVQRCGGRINASTGPRATRYYFEVPAERLEEAAERLLDMLVSPRLALLDQQHERQIIQAEYLARAADPTQLGQSALLTSIAPGHPVAGFHAGNADTLKPGEPTFQRALLEFHQRHYRAAHCRLALVGPRECDQLLALGERLAARLPVGAALQRQPCPLPVFSARHYGLKFAEGPPRLWIGLVLRDPTGDFELAVRALELQLTSRLPGSLSQRLVIDELAFGVTVHRPYLYGGEAILALEVPLPESSASVCAQVLATLSVWLECFARRIDEAELPLQARPAEQLAALELALDCLDRPAGQWALSGRARSSLRQMLDSLAATRLPSVLAAADINGEKTEACGFPVRMAEQCLPAPAKVQPFERLPYNPLLSAEVPVPVPSCRWPASLVFQRWTREEVAVCVRVRHGGAPALPQGSLEPRLLPLLAAAEALGIRTRLEDRPASFRFGCIGPAREVACLIAEIGRALSAPGTFAPAPEPALQPVRHLLRALENRLDSLLAGGVGRWQALVALADDDLRPHLAGALSTWPDLAGAMPTAPTRVAGRERIDCPGNDTALVVFCPAPGADAASEALWRYLGQALQAPFYKRMREELQLGYGVFCGFLQSAGQGGLVFAVQSSVASSKALEGHVRDFVERACGQLIAIDEGGLREQANTLAGRMDTATEEVSATFERLWQAHLAGQGGEHLQQVAEALRTLARQPLAGACQSLRASLDEALLLYAPGSLGDN